MEDNNQIGFTIEQQKLRYLYSAPHIVSQFLNDFGIKRSPKFLKVSTAIFTFKLAQKTIQICATFYKEMCSQDLSKNRPILSH